MVSVSVPEYRLNSSLSIITGAQYIGITLGPALGAILAIGLGYRGAILGASLIPLLTGTAVLFYVPADRVARSANTSKDQPRPKLEPFRVSFQFLLAIFIYFILFALNQLIRLATPIALRGIEGQKDVAGHAGLTFSLGGLVSAVSVLLLAPYFFRAGRLRFALAASCVIAAAGLLVLAAASATAVYILGFLIIALVLSAMTPATNTLIAANVSRARRGTAFGVAGSAQALSSMVGPTAAALFAAVSFSFGFALLAGLLVAVGVLLFLALQEPNLADAGLAAGSESAPTDRPGLE